MIDKYGADTVRLFCLFAAPPERDFDWTESGIEGAHRFVNRLWRLAVELAEQLPALAPCAASAEDAALPKARELRHKEHATVKKVGDDITSRFQFNTAIAAVMELVNLMYLAKDELLPDEGGRRVLASALSTTLTLMFPVTPHLCEELNRRLGFTEPLVRRPWPSYNEEALARETVTVILQVNGKLRGKLELPADAGEEAARSAALDDANVNRHLEGLTVRKVVLVPVKLVNIVAN